MTVDLNTCIEGQKLWLRNGQVISYSKRIYCADGGHYHAALYNGRVLTYTDEGSYCFDGKEDIRDVIEILPLETTEPPKAASHSIVDLNTCVPGQKCVTGDEKYLTYVKRVNGSISYPHFFLDEDSRQQTFTDDGMLHLHSPNSKYNIVRIIPMDSTTSDKHPSITWWESCPWITDRNPTKEDADEFGRVLVKPTEPARILTAFFQDVRIKEAWIHHGNWQPPVLSNKEQAIKLIDKYKEGVIPTPEQWNIIRAGLED